MTTEIGGRSKTNKRKYVLEKSAGKISFRARTLGKV
jgi:hypothetical protein